MIHKTTDLYLAAAFLSLGAKLDHVDRENPKHMDFVFQADDPTPLSTIMNANKVNDVLDKQTEMVSVIPFKSLDLDDIETQWANDTLMVSASKYAEAIRRMKSLVHSKS